MSATEKLAHPQRHRPPNTDTPSEGTHVTPQHEQAPSGALNAEGHRPVLERSRKVR
jgi:hypothetical protein